MPMFETRFFFDARLRLCSLVEQVALNYDHHRVIRRTLPNRLPKIAAVRIADQRAR